VSVAVSVALWERVSDQRGWQPAADVYESQASVNVTVELPGVSPDDVEVRFAGNTVVIQGQRRLPELDAGGVFHAAEIRRGPFRLELVLPARVATERIVIRGEHGLLFLSMTKVDGSHGY
jgi:HSP20 family protein